MMFGEWLHWLDEPGYALFQYLVGVLWQSTLLFGFVGILTVVLRKRRPGVRHALWLGALLLAPFLPALAPFFARTGAPQTPVSVLPTYIAPAPSGQPVAIAPPVAPRIPVVELSTEAETAPAVSSTALDTPEAVPTYRWQDCPWALLFLSYLIGVTFLTGRFLLGHLRIWMWRRGAETVKHQMVCMAFKDASTGMGLKYSPQLLQSKAISIPVTLGVFRPLILLPIEAVCLTFNELRTIALHETAHVKRRDPLVLHLTALVRVVLFFHPLVWVATRQISTLAEHAADDAVLDAGVDPISYAELLTNIAECLPRYAPATEFATGIMLSKGPFIRRIEAVLGDRARVRRLTRWAIATTLVAAIIAVGVVLALPLGNQQPPTADAPVEILGQVVDEEGRPVAGASVTVSPTPSFPYEENVITDTEGRFVFTGLSNSKPYFDLFSTHPDYAFCKEKIIAQPDKSSYETTLVLERGLELGGRLLDTSGNPVSGVQVTVYKIRSSDQPRADFIETKETVSDDDGYFKFNMLELDNEDKVRLYCQHNNISSITSEYEATREELLSGSWTVTLIMQEATYISGKAVFINEQPAANMDIVFALVSREDGATIKTRIVKTDEEGNFTTWLPRLETYDGYASIKNDVNHWFVLVQKVSPASEDLKLVLDNRHSIEVSVTTLTIPDSAFTVVVKLKNPTTMNQMNVSGNSLQEKLPLLGGSVNFTGLCPGEYSVSVYTQHFTAKHFTKNVVISDAMGATNEQVQFNLPEPLGGSYIRENVTLPRKEKLPEGVVTGKFLFDDRTPARGITEYRFHWNFDKEYKMTLDEGRQNMHFDLGALVGWPGVEKLRSNTAGTSFKTSIMGKPEACVSVLVNVRPNHKVKRDIVLPRDDHRDVRIKWVDQDGKKPSGVLLLVARDDMVFSYQTYLITDDSEDAVHWIAEDVFVFENIPKGKLLVAVKESSSDANSPVYRLALQKAEDWQTLVVLDDDRQCEVEVVVVNGKGEAVPVSWISTVPTDFLAANHSSMSLMPNAFTAATKLSDGKFHISGLPAGEYTIDLAGYPNFHAGTVEAVPDAVSRVQINVDDLKATTFEPQPEPVPILVPDSNEKGWVEGEAKFQDGTSVKGLRLFSQGAGRFLSRLELQYVPVETRYRLEETAGPVVLSFDVAEVEGWPGMAKLTRDPYSSAGTIRIRLPDDLGVPQLEMHALLPVWLEPGVTVTRDLILPNGPTRSVRVHWAGEKPLEPSVSVSVLVDDYYLTTSGRISKHEEALIHWVSDDEFVVTDLPRGQVHISAGDNSVKTEPNETRVLRTNGVWTLFATRYPGKERNVRSGILWERDAGQVLYLDTTRQSTIQGRVVNRAGEAVAGAVVSANLEEFAPAGIAREMIRALSMPITCAETDKDGNYQLDALPPGHYIVSTGVDDSRDSYKITVEQNKTYSLILLDD